MWVAGVGRASSNPAIRSIQTAVDESNGSRQKISLGAKKANVTIARLGENSTVFCIFV